MLQKKARWSRASRDIGRGPGVDGGPMSSEQTWMWARKFRSGPALPGSLAGGKAVPDLTSWGRCFQLATPKTGKRTSRSTKTVAQHAQELWRTFARRALLAEEAFSLALHIDLTQQDTQ